MALFTSIVDLESIQVPNSDFKPELYATEIEALARKILHLEASIHIPVVRSLGIDEYELVSEHLVYYAYLKARELDENLPDRLMVFIMDAKNEADIRAQLDVTAKINQKSEGNSGSANSDLKLSNLEDRVTQTSEQMTRAIAQLKIELLEAIDTKLPKPIPALEAFNRIDEPAIAAAALSKMAFLGNKKAQGIVQKLTEFKQDNPGQEFKGFAEVLKAIKSNPGARALSEKAMIEAIDRWN
ncbi:MAG: hypothetical protein LH679_14450 [Cyanobacteria bacterium CAN_BIN43]|nr:hypothetical protein [Cyanobacteria bacterium CAN_BIN43]